MIKLGVQTAQNKGSKRPSITAGQKVQKVQVEDIQICNDGVEDIQIGNDRSTTAINGYKFKWLQRL